VSFYVMSFSSIVVYLKFNPGNSQKRVLGENTFFYTFCLKNRKNRSLAKTIGFRTNTIFRKKEFFFSFPAQCKLVFLIYIYLFFVYRQEVIYFFVDFFKKN